MNRDENFKAPQPRIEDFTFGAETARVFDDMLDRSVPFYSETQRMIGELARDFAQAGSMIYDLGCSTGTTLISMDRAIAVPVTLIGVDSSVDMLDKARLKMDQSALRAPYRLLCQTLEEDLQIEDASVIVMNLTLQFVRPLHRDRLIRTLTRGLRPKGCLILVEKVLGQDSGLNRLFIQHYYDFKRRNGYSDLEIAQKREALENVLIPYQDTENRALLLNNGFGVVETFFRWYNFTGLIAIKTG